MHRSAMRRRVLDSSLFTHWTKLPPHPFKIIDNRTSFQIKIGNLLIRPGVRNLDVACSAILQFFLIGYVFCLLYKIGSRVP
jgi:hypothetical protein